MNSKFIQSLIYLNNQKSKSKVTDLTGDKSLNKNEKNIKQIQHNQAIGYKKKISVPPSKNTHFQKQSDDEIESAHSLKSGVISEDSETRNSKKNTPLPELYRQKGKRMFMKNLAIGQNKQINNYFQKQVRQQDILVLKQKNNYLTTQNMKLKTKVMALEKQIAKNNKMDEQKPGLVIHKDPKLKGNQVMSLKMTIKNLRKELDQQQKENQKIKWSIKFTRISQLEIQRQQIIAETTRLRQLLEQQQTRRALYKAKQQGLSGVEQKLHSLSEKNNILQRQNSQLQKKIKGLEEGSKRPKPISENEKNLSKMLFNAKKIIKQKEKEIETLKSKGSQNEVKVQSMGSINNQSKNTGEAPTKIASHNRIQNNDKKIMSKSAQKYHKKQSQQSNESNSQCQNCKKLRTKITELQKKIQQLNNKLKENSLKFSNMGEFSREEIKLPSKEEVKEITRFLVFRFKAHHLNMEDAQKYLINNEVTDTVKKEQISVLELAQSLVAQPFSLLSNRFLEVCLIALFYPSQMQSSQKSQKIKIDETKKITKGQLLQNFTKLIQKYQIMPQQKQQQMFIQIAQLVTNYHQHILTALNRKRNGQGTISEAQFLKFFQEIQLQKQFVDFIICQIILQSLDMQHLNYYTMFQIFYMPNQQGLLTGEQEQAQQNQPNKKKFQVDYNQVVKEQDEQYEESKSHVDSRKKTLSRNEQGQVQEQDDDVEARSPAQRSEKEKFENVNIQLDDSGKINKEHRKQYRNKSMKSMQSSSPEKSTKNKAQQVQRQKNVKKQQKTKQSPKKDKKKSQQIQQYEQQQYEAEFEEEKMDHPVEQQKANEQIDQNEDYHPYMMEEEVQNQGEESNQNSKKDDKANK